MHAGTKMCTLGGKESEVGSELTRVRKEGSAGLRWHYQNPLESAGRKRKSEIYGGLLFAVQFGDPLLP